MNKSAKQFSHKRNGFHLNLQIIADSFADTSANVELHCLEDPLRLDGLRLYKSGLPMQNCYLYFLEASQVSPDFSHYKDLSFVVFGRTDLSIFSESCNVLNIWGSSSSLEVFNSIQETFEKYFNWDDRLQLALGSMNPLDDMLESSLEIFHNPIFAHDTNFYILSCPRHVTGLSEWVRDSRTGRLIAPLSLIHDFQLDEEYQRTLTTHGPHMYSEEMRGYRILYMNLWVNGNYQGRLCVSELQSEILPGYFAALEYLGSFIELCIQRHNLFQISMGNDIRQHFHDIISGSSLDPQAAAENLRYLNWSPNDRYLVIRLETQQTDSRMHSSIATIGHIEAQIPAGLAFTYQEGIVAVINLSFKHTSVSEVLSSLAILLREGLFKMGVSSEFRDFGLLPQGYLQAYSALRLGIASESMIWCYRFDDYLLEYMFAQISQQINPQFLTSSKLEILREYDRSNHTELYLTLKTYLNLERNALQTSKALFIHRSTLAYRLDRIYKLVKTDFDDPKDRLLYQLCFMLAQPNEKSE